MTQEEKAKAYDEALERAKFYHGNCPSEPERKKLEKMFPALRESKDERIRKSLIKFLTDIKEISESGRTSWAVRKEDAEMCKSFIAWLEKQKESLHIPETCEENANSFIDGIIEVRSFQRGMEEGRKLEKQKEQKLNPDKEELIRHCIGLILTDATDERFKDYGLTLKDCLTWLGEQKEQNGEDGFLEDELSAFLQNYDKEYDDDAAVSDVARHFYEIGKKQKEQKPFNVCEQCPYYKTCPDYNAQKFAGATINGEPIPTENKSVDIPLAEWGEEDESMLNTIIADVKFVQQKCGLGTDEWNVRSKTIRWIKFLPERFNLQPKQEWSEEDERMQKEVEKMIVLFT